MKTIYKTLVLLLMCISSAMAFAQDNDPWVGTWEGVETITVPDKNSDGYIDFQKKIVVRISKYGDTYGVRVKEISVSNPSDMKYWNDCKVTYSDNSTIKYQSYIQTSYDWDSTYKNGSKVYSAVYTWVVSALYSNGRITLEKFIHTDYKDKNGSFIGTQDTRPKKLSLYKQESDW